MTHRRPDALDLRLCMCMDGHQPELIKCILPLRELKHLKHQITEEKYLASEHMVWQKIFKKVTLSQSGRMANHRVLDQAEFQLGNPIHEISKCRRTLFKSKAHQVHVLYDLFV